MRINLTAGHALRGMGRPRSDGSRGGLGDSIAKRPKATGPIAGRGSMAPDFGGGLYFGQSLREVPASLEYALESLPSTARDRVRVSKGCLVWNVRRHFGIRLAYRLPIAEVPCFQFFYRDSGDDLPIGASGSAPRSKPGSVADLL